MGVDSLKRLGICQNNALFVAKVSTVGARLDHGFS